MTLQQRRQCIRWCWRSLLCACALLCSCEKSEGLSQAEAELYVKDVHVSIAQHSLVLPFVALGDFAYRQPPLSWDPSTSTRDRPQFVDRLSVSIETYGWVDSGFRPNCQKLTRRWAQSVCDNPWSAIRQALPSHSFKLLDLSHARVGDPKGPVNCIDDGNPRAEFPARSREAKIVCGAQVFRKGGEQYFFAVVRIDGDLGALWTVGPAVEGGENLRATTDRQGAAIVALVQNGLGAIENFQPLHDAMCSLRPPGAKDGPKGPDCVSTGE